MESPKTLQQAIIHFADTDNCVAFLIARRWPDGVVRCPTCGSEGVKYVPTRRVWQCKTRHAKCQFSIKVGTIFEDSAIGLDKWLTAMWLVANSKNGISSHEVARSLGVTQKSAWHVLHRIRLTMKHGNASLLGEGGNNPVEVDETYVGGKPKNMHKGARLKMKIGMNGYAEKATVMGMLARGTREVRAKVIPNAKRETLQKEILEQVGFGSTVYTDGWVGYDGLNRKQFVHETVNHMEEYVRGSVHTQGIENFWSLLKRGLNGTYVAVEPFHLDAYVDEQVFRYNNRRSKSDADRFNIAVTQILGKRLTYAELTGKNEKKRVEF
ncbi:MAG: IS1595 family transposase [Acidobacteriaceae bacterium]